MKKRTISLAFVLVLAISMVLPISAGAWTTPPLSTGAITVSCTAVRFTGTVATGEQVRLTVQLHNGPYWYLPFLQNDSFLITTAGSYDKTVAWAQNPDGKAYRVVIEVSTDGGASWQNLAVKEDVLSCPPPPGGEGCTPGYWKNHLSDWPPTGYSPSQDFDTVFGVNYFTPNITLLQAVSLGGGGYNKIARHGTAALLSAAHPDVNYPYTVAQVIAFVQAKNIDPLVDANELGCSIP